MPMTELVDASSYNLPRGRLVVAKVQTYNNRGWSDYSIANVSGVTAEVVPESVTLPTRGDLTTQT